MRRIIFWITTLVVSLMIVMMAPVGPSSFVGVQTAAAQLAVPSKLKAGPNNAITDVPGIKVGHFADASKRTGATAIIIEGGGVPGVEVRGGCPGTLDLDLIKPGTCGDYIHGISLSCGSCYGYGSEVGIREFLKEKGLGLPSGPGIVVPLVPGAICYDLNRCGVPYKTISGKDRIMYGYNAAMNAQTGPVEQGRVGAGLGSGWSLGTASVDLGNGVMVGAIVVNNTGTIFNTETCQFWGRMLEIKDANDNWEFSKYGLKDAQAGVTGLSSSLLASTELFYANEAEPHTAIGAVATNVTLDKAQARRVAVIAMGGDEKSVRPGAGPFDGDTIVAVSTEELPLSALGPDSLWGSSSSNVGLIGAAAADAYARAFIHAVLSAQRTYNEDGSVCQKNFQDWCPSAYK